VLGTGSIWLCAALAVVLCSAGRAAAGVIKNPGPEIGETEILGPLVGPGAVPVPPGLLFYGTDLGWTFQHDGALEILFGDTWIVSNSLCLGAPANDDSAGVLPASIPVGVPDVDFHTKPAAPNQFAPIELHRSGVSLPLGYGQVPLTGWSDGADAGVLFGRGEIVRCAPKGAKQTCKPARAKAGEPRVGPKRGLVCATDLGACMPGGALPCEIGTGAGCGFGQTCEAPDAGFCIDETSSQIAAPSDRRFAVAHANEIGIRRDAAPTVYDSAAIWRTNKFRNATARAVARFRPSGAGNDWTPGTDALLVLGRPGFTGEEGREAQLYLAVLDLPLRTGKAGKVRFAPRYFAGVKANGRARWTRDEAKAAPLAQDGVVGGDPHEALPQPLQMGIGWVGAPLSKWVMLYGGDLADYLLADPANGAPGPAPGAVRIRFSDEPWGPWSVAHPILAPGDPGTVGDPYGPGGVLYHSECVDVGPNECAPSDPTRPLHVFNPGCGPFPLELDHGGFYGANLIDAYTGPDGLGGVQLVWNVSTWNPYGVLFLRTRIEP
jgi:hypothetical protein